jgi:Rifampin ADP-ribosyl transferase
MLVARGATDESTRFYHGTRAALNPGAVIEPARPARAGAAQGATSHVCLSACLDEVIWDAELALGDGPGRVYRVEPVGQVEVLSGRKSPGHPSMPCRSRQPLRVAGEVIDWKPHSPEALKAMKDGLERLEALGTDLIDE